MKYDVIVVGGGASGMLCAITAARRGRKVLLLEGSDRLGRKILATGNGRCNFTHEAISENQYFTDDFALLFSVLKQVPTEKVLSLFEEAGMLYKNKNGYYYPYNENASTVLELLLMQLREQKVSCICNSTVKRVEKQETGYVLYGEDFSHTCESVVLCVGSKAGGFYKPDGLSPYTLATDLGLKCSDIFPALTRVHCREKSLSDLAGVRASGCVSLWIDGLVVKQDVGEVQFTKNGLSGIVIFQLSALVAEALNRGCEVSISCDFLEESFTKDVFENMISRYPTRKACELLALWIHKKIVHVILKDLGIDLSATVEELPPKLLSKIFKRLHALSFQVKAVDSMENAQVCHGGLFLNQFDEAMQSKELPGLFACGELLNVDGICGGYNLHFAWASGYLAGLKA